MAFSAHSSGTIQEEVFIMRTASKLLTNFLGGVNINKTVSVNVDQGALSTVFPNGIPTFTCSGGLHFSFRKEGNNVVTTIRKAVVPAN